MRPFQRLNMMVLSTVDEGVMGYARANECVTGDGEFACSSHDRRRLAQYAAQTLQFAHWTGVDGLDTAVHCRQRQGMV